MSSLSNFPSFNPPNPLLGYESPLVPVVLGTEPSSIVRFLFLCCNSSWMKSVFTSLTTVWFWFSLTNIRLWLNHHSGLVTTESASDPLCCIVSTLYLNNFSNTHNCHLYATKNFKGFPHRLFYFVLTTALVKQGRVLLMRKQDQTSCSSCRESLNSRTRIKVFRILTQCSELQLEFQIAKRSCSPFFSRKWIIMKIKNLPAFKQDN